MLLTFYTFINNQAWIFAMMTQSKIAIIAIIIIIPLVSVILWSDESTKNLETSEDELQVYVSFYPLHETTQAIIGQKADVKILTPPNIDPHDFDPSIKLIQEMKTADLIILNGGGFESWISNLEFESDQLLDSSNGISFLKTKSVDHHKEHDEHDDDPHTEEFYEEVASVIEEFEHGHMTELQSIESIEEILHEHEGDGHGHGTGVIEDIEHLLHEIEDGHIEGSHGLEEIHHLVSGEDVHDEHDEHDEHEEHEEHALVSDPHIWLNPNLVKIQVKNIAERLSQIDPANSESYNENASQYIEKLELLDLEIREELSSCSKKDFITYHNAFSYFSDEYGLTQHTITKGVHDHSATPTAKSIEDVIDLAKELDLRVIFAEDTSDIRISQVVADEIGADVLILSPVATEDTENKNYFERMQQNTANLKKALCN
mgnify:CR=1 FL=1